MAEELIDHDKVSDGVGKTCFTVTRSWIESHRRNMFLRRCQNQRMTEKIVAVASVKILTSLIKTSRLVISRLRHACVRKTPEFAPREISRFVQPG